MDDALGADANLGFLDETMRAAFDPFYTEFVARLRSARKASGYTQSELAELLCKPQSYVSKVETAERRIDVIEAARWCMALGLSLESVLPANLTVSGNSSTKKRFPKTNR